MSQLKYTVEAEAALMAGFQYAIHQVRTILDIEDAIPASNLFGANFLSDIEENIDKQVRKLVWGIDHEDLEHLFENQEKTQ